MVKNYQYTEDMSFTACMYFMLSLDDTLSNFASEIRKKMREWLIDNEYLEKEDNKTIIGKNGPAHGIYEKEAVNSKGEKYIGIFYGKEMQELMYSKIPELVSQIEGESAGRNFRMDRGYVRCDFNGAEIRFKRVFAGHKLTDDEINRLIAGEIITISASEGKSFRGRLQQRTNENNRPYYGFTPDFDSEFKENM